ncbi:MAG TPA: flagellar regulator YcgR PilZN domain-containing protein [Burkholderiaceae bacterium]|nr:flagellar regulator YcgR PilZN domain-containing protein [Burkholderiaceae bacterium]
MQQADMNVLAHDNDDESLDDGFERFRIEEPYEIVALARELRDRRTLLTLHATGTDATLVTALLDVREDVGELVFDFAADQRRRRAFVEAQRVLAVALLDRIRIQFAVEGLREAADPHLPVAVAAIPEFMLRFQRRGDFRVQPFKSEPATVDVPVNGERKPLRCEIADISATGVALFVPARADSPLTEHSLVTNCTISLPGQPQFPCTIEVCYLKPEGTTGKQSRAGCRLHDLPPGAARSVQQFILHVERKRRAIERRED